MTDEPLILDPNGNPAAAPEQATADLRAVCRPRARHARSRNAGKLRSQIDDLSRANAAAWETINANNTTIAYCVAQIAVLERRTGLSSEVSRQIITDVRAPMG